MNKTKEPLAFMIDVIEMEKTKREMRAIQTALDIGEPVSRATYYRMKKATFDEAGSFQIKTIAAVANLLKVRISEMFDDNYLDQEPT